MLRTMIIATALLGLAMPAWAASPNINPGLWEYTNKMSFDSDAPVPDQEHSSQECVTADEVGRGDTFLEDMDECDITHQDMSRDAMDYGMSCTGPDGTRMDMDASVQFGGNSVSGVFTGNMETPMGPMQMNIQMEGRRIGDC